MAKAEILMPFILSWEGGFANVAGDRGGATMPVKFKLGENKGVPEYYTFTDMDTFTDLYTGAVAYIHATLDAGW